MTPLLAAWSSLRDASRSRVSAAALSPALTASLNLRMAVFRDDFTDLLRRRRFSFCLLRLICDLMFATRQPRPGRSGLGWRPGASPAATSQPTRPALPRPKRARGSQRGQPPLPDGDGAPAPDAGMRALA